MHIANIGSKTRAFINHKTFHPGNFKNVEAVWQAEEKKRKQEKYIKERAHTRAEEAKIEALKGQLRQFESSTGTKNQSIHGLDWMYANPAEMEAKDHEVDILLGRVAAVPKQRTVGDALKNQDISTAEVDGVSEDTLRKLREDPLYMIKLASFKQREKLMANPYTRVKVLAKEREEYEAVLQETPEGRLYLSLQNEVKTLKDNIKEEKIKIRDLERKQERDESDRKRSDYRHMDHESKRRKLDLMREAGSKRYEEGRLNYQSHKREVKKDEEAEVDNILNAALKRKLV